MRDAGNGSHLPREILAELDRLKNALPSHTEIARLLANLDEPTADDGAKDHYVAIVAANAVGGALDLKLIEHGCAEASILKMDFKARINKSLTIGILSPQEAEELHRVREVRNAFAHALAPVSFSTPAITGVQDRQWDYPVTNWAQYFLPVFLPRVRFAIVCGAFIDRLRPPFPTA